MRMSWSVLLIACPRCSAPVTFGGGITMQYGSPGAAGSAWKHPSASHTRYASDSTDAGSYVLASSVFMSQSLAASPNRREIENTTEPPPGRQSLHYVRG